jgi:hypothetical protein
MLLDYTMNGKTVTNTRLEHNKGSAKNLAGWWPTGAIARVLAKPVPGRRVGVAVGQRWDRISV